MFGISESFSETLRVVVDCSYDAKDGNSKKSRENTRYELKRAASRSCNSCEFAQDRVNFAIFEIDRGQRRSANRPEFASILFVFDLAPTLRLSITIGDRPLDPFLGLFLESNR